MKIDLSHTTYTIADYNRYLANHENKYNKLIALGGGNILDDSKVGFPSYINSFELGWMTGNTLEGKYADKVITHTGNGDYTYAFDLIGTWTETIKGEAVSLSFGNPGWPPENWISGPVKNEKGPIWLGHPSLSFTEKQKDIFDFCVGSGIIFGSGIGKKELYYSPTSYASKELSKSNELSKIVSNYFNTGKLKTANYWYSPTISDPTTYKESINAHKNASWLQRVVGTMDLVKVTPIGNQYYVLEVTNELSFSSLMYHIISKENDWGNGSYFGFPLSKVTQHFFIIFQYKQ